MSEMVERVAEAIRLRSIERGHPIHPVMVRHLAAAAIEAMREPTEEMINAGWKMLPFEHPPEYPYREMIDAALKGSS
jgi:hypothetical protein